MEILEFVRILKEKLKMAIVLFIAGILIGGVAYVVLPSIYECSVTFMVLESKLIRRNLEGKDLDIDTYLQFVDNESIFRSVFDQLDIAGRFGMDFENFRRSFEVTSVEDTAIIDLVVTFGDAGTAHDIARSVGEEALKLNRFVIEQEVSMGRSFTESEVVTAREKLANSKLLLDNFLLENPVNQMALQLDALRNRLVAEEIGTQTTYPMMEIQSYIGGGVFQSVAGGGDETIVNLSQLENRILELEARLGTATGDKIKSETQAELKELRNLYDKRKQSFNRLKGELRKLEQAYYPLKNRYAELLSEFDAAQKGYAEIYAQGLVSKLEIAGKTKEMTIIDQAVYPDQKIFPKLIWMLIGGIFLGILAAFAYVMMVGFNRKLADD